MKFYTSVLLFPTLFLISSCEEGREKSESSSFQSTVSTDANADSFAVKPSLSPSNKMEVKTFEVKDSTGKTQGWGYDIYIENKKMIHQPIIPAIPGNRAFKTESDAKKTGLFALGKMIKEATLPTITTKELDSLGVIK